MPYEIMPPVDQVWIDTVQEIQYPGESLNIYAVIQIMEHAVPGFTQPDTFLDSRQPQYRLTRAFNPQPSPFPAVTVG